MVAAAAMLAATTAAFAQSAAEKSGVNSVLGIAPSTQDFVTEAASSDMFEVASSKLALERSDDPTKSFAQQMIQDHTKTTDELKALIEDKKINVTLPTAMSDAQQKMMKDLQDKQGDDFTKQYHSDQVKGHKEAVSLFKRYSNGGEQADLKAWAAKTLPTLEHHLDMANALNK
jgi:putative membrane protein